MTVVKVGVEIGHEGGVHHARESAALAAPDYADLTAPIVRPTRGVSFHPAPTLAIASTLLCMLRALTRKSDLLKLPNVAIHPLSSFGIFAVGERRDRGPVMAGVGGVGGLL